MRLHAELEAKKEEDPVQNTITKRGHHVVSISERLQELRKKMHHITVKIQTIPLGVVTKVPCKYFRGCFS